MLEDHSAILRLKWLSICLPIQFLFINWFFSPEGFNCNISRPAEHVSYSGEHFRDCSTVVWSMKCKKTMKNGQSVFPKAQVVVPTYTQLKDIQFSAIEEERKLKIFTLKKMESENFDFFSSWKLTLWVSDCWLRKINYLKTTDPGHPLSKDFMLLPSGRWHILPRCRTTRRENSLVPASTGLLNGWIWYDPSHWDRISRVSLNLCQWFTLTHHTKPKPALSQHLTCSSPAHCFPFKPHDSRVLCNMNTLASSSLHCRRVCTLLYCTQNKRFHIPTGGKNQNKTAPHPIPSRLLPVKGTSDRGTWSEAADW